MSEKPLDLNKEREYHIRRIVTAIENMVAALSDDRYEIIWLNEGDFFVAAICLYFRNS